jgi:hypothetical protein
MAKKELVESIVKLYAKLGGNMNDVLGSRSNITFLGTGKNPEPFVDMSINMEAVGALGKSKILEELKSPIGYLTADKLNDVQAGKLYENMLKLDEFYNPRQIANITDMATGIRNLDQEGLGALRAEQSLADDVVKNVSDAEYNLRSNFPKASDKDIKDMLRLNIDNIDDLPPPGSRGGADDIAAPVMNVEDVVTMQGKGGMDFIDFVRRTDPEGAAKLQKEVDRLNAASDAADARFAIANMPDAASKRASAREFLVEALKVDDTFATKLGTIVDAQDVKYITEGGGGIMGDPLILVEKYFGPRILEALPSGATGEDIITFTRRVMDNVKDAAGLKPDNPRFDRFTARFVDEVQDFAKGGLAKILEV